MHDDYLIGADIVPRSQGTAAQVFSMQSLSVQNGYKLTT